MRLTDHVFVWTCFSVGRQTQKITNLLWFFNVGLSSKNVVKVRNWQMKTLETLLKDNNHTEARA